MEKRIPCSVWWGWRCGGDGGGVELGSWTLAKHTDTYHPYIYIYIYIYMCVCVCVRAVNQKE